MFTKWIRCTGLIWTVLCMFSSYKGFASDEPESLQTKAMTLVARFSQESGCIPEISLSRALCQVVCCPCCVPCLLLNMCSETFTCPSTRRIRLYERARVALGQWKVQAERRSGSGNTTAIRTFNDYLAQHRQTRSPSGQLLFENDTDFAAFYSDTYSAALAGNTTTGGVLTYNEPPPPYQQKTDAQ